jgi:hypothetical protein
MKGTRINHPEEKQEEKTGRENRRTENNKPGILTEELEFTCF